MTGLEESANGSTKTKFGACRALEPFVAHLRVVPLSEHAAPYVRLPDGQTELVLRRGPSDEWLKVVGTRSRALRKPSGGRADWCVVVRFRAGGAYPFFGVPASELTDDIVSLDEVWGPSVGHLRRALERAESAADCVAATEETLSGRLFGPRLYEPASAPRIRRAVRQLEHKHGLPSVEGLARELSMSARQLRRAFGEVVGMSPKRYLRIVRFQRALRMTKVSLAPDWGAIAQEVGYFDQAHMIADFRALAGETPAALHRSIRRP